MFVRSVRCITLLFALTTLVAIVETRADEGMWTFDNPPVKLLKARYGFTPTQAWLEAAYAAAGAWSPIATDTSTLQSFDQTPATMLHVMVHKAAC